MVEDWDYLIAWLIYLLAGLGCCLVWWRITRGLTRALRDLLRGLVVVLIFTPWYAGAAEEFLAPAIVVLLFDLFLEGAKGGLTGGVALLSMLFVLLLFLTVKQFQRKRPLE